MCLFKHTVLLKKILLVKLKNIYTLERSNLNYDTVKQLFSFQIYRKYGTEDVNLKFRSEFKIGFSNHGYLKCAILKAVFDF